MPGLLALVNPRGEHVRGSSKGEVLHGLGYDELTSAIEVEAGISVHMADLRKAHHEWRIGHDAVEALVLYRLEPRTLAQFDPFLCVRCSNGSAGELEGSLMDISSDDALCRIQLPEDLNARACAQI